MAMGEERRRKMLEGDVREAILSLTYPMIFGMVGMVIFNIIDTFYVGMLGTDALAALTFTFPVVLIVQNLVLGLGMGVSSVVARTAGAGNREKLLCTVFESILMALILAALVSTAGLLTMDPLFRLLGAEGKILEMVRAYMNIWYIGSVFIVFPMTGNNILRASGETKIPALIMTFAAVLNGIFDPLLIFGIGPFPAMGIEGAAAATVISRFLTFMAIMIVLVRREKLLAFVHPSPGSFGACAREVFHVAVPAAVTRLAAPAAAAVVTRILASYGRETVAGFGIGTRLEFFAVAFIAAMSTVAGPFAGQNYGAGRFGRIGESFRFVTGVSLKYGLAVFVFFLFSAEPVVSLFSSDGEVIHTAVLFLRTVSLSYGFLGIMLLANSMLSALNRPYRAALVNVVQMFAVYVPLAFLLERFLGPVGVFAALAVSYFVAGGLSFCFMRAFLKSGYMSPGV